MTGPVVRLGGFDRTCMECHQMFQSQPETPGDIFQHDHIKLDHGLNDRCFNCHHKENRDLLVLQGTRTIGYDASERL